MVGNSISAWWITPSVNGLVTLSVIGGCAPVGSARGRDFYNIGTSGVVRAYVEEAELGPH